jgi:hypothetical protein
MIRTSQSDTNVREDLRLEKDTDARDDLDDADYKHELMSVSSENIVDHGRQVFVQSVRK